MIRKKNRKTRHLVSSEYIDAEMEDDYKSKRAQETEPLTGKNRDKSHVYDKRYDEEMQKLSKLTEMLKTQQELHNYEKRLIL